MHNLAAHRYTRHRVSAGPGALDVGAKSSSRRHGGRWRVAEEEVAWLRTLPTELSFRCDDYRFHAVHASPADHLFSYRLTPDLDAEEMKKEVAEVRADIVLVGHTHLPMSRGAWSKVVLNPGSIGQPLDGDPPGELCRDRRRRGGDPARGVRHRGNRGGGQGDEACRRSDRHADRHLADRETMCRPWAGSRARLATAERSGSGPRPVAALEHVPPPSAMHSSAAIPAPVPR